MMRRNDILTAPRSYGIPFPDRVQALRRVADLLQERRAEVLRILCEASNHHTAAGEIDAAIGALRGAEAEVLRFRPPAIAQIAVLMPSNIPLYGYVLYLLVPSLYAERVVFRPSGRNAGQAERLHKLLGTAHDLPLTLAATGQRAFLDGPAADADAVVFTGAFDNAEAIRGRLAARQLFLYFGQGINPFVVGPDADLGLAVDGAVRARMLNSGQDCFGPDVFFVHDRVADRFLELLCGRVERLRHGAYDDPGADYGSLYYPDAFRSALDHLHEHRARIVAGGRADLAERHLGPTVLVRPAATPVRPPELFAPIFDVVPYTDDAWLRTLLTHPYFEERAMAATVYGDAPGLVDLLSRRHTVSVNETLIDIENGNAPFGGSGVRANYASVGGVRHTGPLLVSKAVADHVRPEGDPR